MAETVHVLALLSVALALTSCAATSRLAPVAGPWPLVYAEDFATPDGLAGFAFTDPASWRWSDVHGRASLTLLGGSRYEPPFRSPTSIALVPDLEVADFDLEVDLLQTGRDYAHRDLCLFFGWQSPTRFYYVHLATTPDANAHNVFRVADAPRTNLAPVAARGVDWGTSWHHVRLERRAAAGTIRLFWDRAAEPILTAACTAFDWGRIGLGSFDDSGCMTSIRVWAPARRSVREAQPFPPMPRAAASSRRSPPTATAQQDVRQASPAQ
ncbi:MAG TPA: hypothetical protein VFD82_04415 [Planctomycetota bacterium]|nr:hypothetical protein [Planctomycetota bacterium]